MTPEQLALGEWLEGEIGSMETRGPDYAPYLADLRAHLATFRSMVERQEKLEGAFVNYSDHKYTCALHVRKPCNCGLNEVEEELGL